jgi:hypothetical protein
VKKMKKKMKKKKRPSWIHSKTRVPAVGKRRRAGSRADRMATLSSLLS